MSKVVLEKNWKGESPYIFFLQTFVNPNVTSTLLEWEPCLQVRRYC